VNEVNENKVPFTKKQQLKYNRCYAIGRNYEVLFCKEFQQSYAILSPGNQRETGLA